MYGWDWGAILPDAGIWRDVYLDVINHSMVKDVEVLQTNDLDNKISKLTIKVQNDLSL